MTAAEILNTGSPFLDADEILAKFNGAWQDAQTRLGRHAAGRRAYFGDTASDANVVAMDTTGRPLQRYEDLRGDLLNRKGALNMIQPVVDNFIAYKGQLPLIRVEPEEQNPEGEERALVRTRWLRQQFDNSDMDLQQIDAAFYLSALGDVIVIVEPVLPEHAGPFDEPGVQFTVYSPEICFPRFHVGRRRIELRELFLAWDLSVEEAMDQYPRYLRENKSLDQTVSCLTYYSEREKVVLIDDQEVIRVKHDLGFVPAQWIRNKHVGDSLGQSDIGQVIDVHEEMQALQIVMGDATIEAVYSPIWVKDAVNQPGDRMVFGPREVIPLGENGAIGRVPPSPPPSAAGNLFSDLKSGLFEGAGVAPVQIENSHSGSNLSGRYMHAEQQPMETRLALQQTIVGYHISQLGKKALFMVGAIPDLSKFTFHIQGQDKGTAYSYDVEGSAMGGRAKVSAKWDSLIGSTRHERVVMGLQMFAQKLVTRSYVLEQAGVDDPEAMLRAVESETKRLSAGQPGQPGEQPGQPGDQQAQIAAPGQEAANAMAGGPPPGGQGDGAGQTPGGAGPGGDAATAPQPVASPQVQAPPFPPLSGPPVMPGMGPSPTSPDPIAAERAAVGDLPPDVASTIVGSPVFVNGSLTVYVTDRRQVANGIIKRAFHAHGLDVKVKVVQ